MTEDRADLDRGSGPDVVIRADARGVILFVSESCRVLGYEPADLVGKLGVDFVHPDDRARFIGNTASIFLPASGSRSDPRVHRFRRKDGSWVWLKGNPKALPTSEGQPGELLNFFEPISDAAAARALAG